MITKIRSDNAATNTPYVGTTYWVILRLVQQLRTEKKLTDRRHAGKDGPVHGHVAIFTVSLLSFLFLFFRLL
jgi:hypothetical protein